MALRMYTHFCEPVRGGDSGQLVKIRPVDPSSLDTLISGRVGSLNSSGQIQLGLASNTAMPLFVFKGVDQPSVYSPGGDGTNTYWVGGNSFAAGTTALALVASGGWEIQTTEFDTSKTYACNDLLTVDSDGKVTNASVTLYTTPVVGVCSVHENAQNNQEPFVTSPTAQPPRGVSANGIETLTFWSVYLPGTGN